MAKSFYEEIQQFEQKMRKKHKGLKGVVIAFTYETSCIVYTHGDLKKKKSTICDSIKTHPNIDWNESNA